MAFRERYGTWAIVAGASEGTGASFAVSGASPARDSALTTTSLEMNWTNGWSAAASFESELSAVTRAYAGKGALRYAW